MRDISVTRMTQRSIETASHLSYVGLLTLGIFVSTLVGIGVRRTTNWSDAGKVVGALLGAALSGSVFTFIQTAYGAPLGEAVFMYPVGLAYGLSWLFADEITRNISSDNRGRQIAGCLHLLGIVLGTVFVLLLLVSPKFREGLP